MSSGEDFPVPPFHLANRVGALSPDRAEEEYRQGSLGLRDGLVSLLPEWWSFEGKRVLDFGCGAGRVLRSFRAEAEASERFLGCDIDSASIDWARENLVPPFEVFANEEEPPLPLEDRSLDLIYAVSVFTHLTDSWSRWLLELHRCLADDGLLIVSLMGGAASELMLNEPWDPDRVGMNRLSPGQPWDHGGPMVFHSPWWVRAHWGRAFDFVLYLEGPHPGVHDWLVMIKKQVDLDPAQLEAPAPDEPRELLAAQHNVRQLEQEIGLHHAYADRLRAWLRELKSSPSWRLTAPLRWLRHPGRRS